MKTLRWPFFIVFIPGLLGTIAAHLDILVFGISFLGPIWLLTTISIVAIHWNYTFPWLDRLNQKPEEPKNLS